jgi:hypothetical protein
MLEHYMGNWGSQKEMLGDFGIPANMLEGIDILVGQYDTPSYEGYAFVLFERDGKLYEVNGSHCSCYGLGSSSISNEGNTQWDPEPTTLEVLRLRSDGQVREVLKEFLRLKGVN